MMFGLIERVRPEIDGFVGTDLHPLAALRPDVVGILGA